MSRHSNNKRCSKCAEIFDAFPKFNVLIRTWFEDIQEKYPEFHIACAGRGEFEQEAAFLRGASKAHYGESAHNYNLAIDTFWLIDGKYSLPVDYYDEYIKPEIPDWLEWGHTWKSFPELPHFELKSWKTLRDVGAQKLVEPIGET